MKFCRSFIYQRLAALGSRCVRHGLRGRKGGSLGRGLERRSRKLTTFLEPSACHDHHITTGSPKVQQPPCTRAALCLRNPARPALQGKDNQARIARGKLEKKPLKPVNLLGIFGEGGGWEEI